MKTFDSNIVSLSSRYPDLAERLYNYPDKSDIRILQAGDGGLFYALLKNEKLFPITNHKNPLQRIQSQLTRNSRQLQDFTKAVLIVGLYPGSELVYIFNLAERCSGPHATQNIFVCIDSPACLYGFLNAFEAHSIIESERVRFFWHEDTEREVARLRADPANPYIFTLISNAPDPVLDEVMPHFVALNRERQKETELLLKENSDYYSNITDKKLSVVVSGSRSGHAGDKRAPRFMTVTCSWSNVVQYSARDTCAAFEKMGWETCHLKTDAMLTPYYMAVQINEFKPDVFLFINHLRTEAQAAYPDNMMFITWIQDFNPPINSIDSASAWNKAVSTPDPKTGKPRKRDLIAGYTGQLVKYGYLAERLLPVNMIVNTDIFRLCQPDKAQKEKYGCKVCFASNASQPVEAVVRESVIPALAEYNFTEKSLLIILNRLRQCYRAEMSFTTYRDLEDELLRLHEFEKPYNALSDAARDQVIQILFWKINDVLYRHVVLEWCVELDADLRIYGLGWEHHPRFARFASGRLEHGEELCAAYQCAEYCLHLNSMEGSHQRLLEIAAAGGRILTRCGDKSKLISPELASAFRHIANNRPLSDIEREAWHKWLFERASSELNQHPDSTPEELEKIMRGALQNRLTGMPDWLTPDWRDLNFENKAELAAILQKK